ncbi:mechanosensitive ion channel family protein [Candidatus Woesearchaeota archaeon]|nr:mechanosensitive ion channel family protein [Candidatus Woesearchaeota archaeon]
MIEEFFQGVISFLDSGPLLKALAIFILFFAVSKLLVYVSEKIILRLTKKTTTVIDDLIIERTNRPLSIILILIGLRIGIIPLGLDEKITNYIELALLALITLLIARIIIIIVEILIDNWGRKWAARTKSSIDDNLMSLMHRFAKVLLYIIALLIIIDSFGVEIGPLLASIGIAGIAIAFALQNTLGNIFGGMSLIVDKSIRAGDKVQLDADTVGIVRDIGLRSTKIKTFNNEIVTIPNGKLADSKIINHSQPDPSIRIIVPVSVAYGTDIDKLEKVLLSEVKKVGHFMKEPAPFVRFKAMGDSALQFNVFFWIESFEYAGDAPHEANTLIYKALSKNRIEIPFPQRVVHMKK